MTWDSEQRARVAILRPGAGVRQTPHVTTPGGAEVLPRLEHVPDLREALDRTLAEAVERVERWILEAGWERDYS